MAFVRKFTSKDLLCYKNFYYNYKRLTLSFYLLFCCKAARQNSFLYRNNNVFYYPGAVSIFLQGFLIVVLGLLYMFICYTLVSLWLYSIQVYFVSKLSSLANR